MFTSDRIFRRSNQIYEVVYMGTLLTDPRLNPVVNLTCIENSTLINSKIMLSS
jgi:hypothetical protein